MSKPKLLVFASGTAEGGGSGFENLVRSAPGILDAEIIGVVSNHEHGGIAQRARTLGVPFIHFPAPYTEEHYTRLMRDYGADFVALSGWLKLVVGLDPKTTINIHPGTLPETAGMHGHFVHEAAIAAFKRGEITHTAVCMHFVTPVYDEGPIFFRFNIKILEDDTPDTLAERVNAYEHRFQPAITNLVVQRKITWDGVKDNPPRCPEGYEIRQFED